MKKIIRLTENDLLKLVKRVINEDEMMMGKPTYDVKSYPSGGALVTEITNIKNIYGVILDSNNLEYLKLFFEPTAAQYYTQTTIESGKKGRHSVSRGNYIEVNYKLNIDVKGGISKAFELGVTTVTKGKRNYLNLYFNFKVIGGPIENTNQQIDIAIPKNMPYEYKQ